MNLEILEKNIGRSYSEIEMGCLSPMYLLHPNLPKFEFINDEVYFIPIIEKHCEIVDSSNIEEGDLVMIKIRNDFHFGVFKTPNLIYHCTKNSRMRLSKIKIYEKYIQKVYRLKKQRS